MLYLSKFMGQPGLFAFSSLELEYRVLDTWMREWRSLPGASPLDSSANKSSVDDNTEKGQRCWFSEHPSRAAVARLIVEVVSLFAPESSLHEGIQCLTALMPASHILNVNIRELLWLLTKTERFCYNVFSRPPIAFTLEINDFLLLFCQH